MAKIIIVEDEHITRKHIQKSLTELGYEVIALASCGEDAVVLAKDLLPDLILMDIQLKGEVDGVNAARQIQTRFDIPVVFLTAYSDDQTAKRVFYAKAYGYVVKPFDVEELNRTIQKALKRHRQNRETKLEGKKKFLQ